jgi:hypothetical protein
MMERKVENAEREVRHDAQPVDGEKSVEDRKRHKKGGGPPSSTPFF